MKDLWQFKEFLKNICIDSTITRFDTIAVAKKDIPTAWNELQNSGLCARLKSF